MRTSLNTTLMAFLFLSMSVSVLNAQSTTIKLPTIDSTSSFIVSDSNSVTLMRLNGDGAYYISGNNTAGYHLAPITGAGARLMWFPYKKSFRAGYVDGTQWDDASIGNNSIAMGTNTIASGNYNTAFGYNTTAIDGYSTSMGANTFARDYSTAMGYGSRAEGHAGTAMGNYTVASHYATSMGNYTRAIGYASTATGDSSTASGDVSTAMGYYSHANGDNSISMGDHTLADGNASTTMGYYTVAEGRASTAMGDSTTAGGYASTAMGFQTSANGDFSITSGFTSTASGFASTAMGMNSTASGYASTAIGTTTSASGNYSLATGVSTTASGVYSTALGYATTSSGSNSTSLGNYVSTNNMSGACIIGDQSTSTITSSSVNNEMTMRFAGGYRLYSNSSLTSGVTLSAGGGSWSSVSDARKKEHFTKANGEYFLNGIAQLNLGSWTYIGQDAKTFRHYGPMAQEIFKYFGNDGVGIIGNDTTLASADMDGIMMICLQALEKRTTELRETNEKIAVIEKQNIERDRLISVLTEKISKLSQLLSTSKTVNQSQISDNNIVEELQ